MIPQREVMQELGANPSVKELLAVIAKLAYNKAPGESQLTTNAIELLGTEALQYLLDIIIAF
jgi:hypothetical protein